MSGRLYIPRVPQEHNYARGSALWRDLVQRHHYMALPIGTRFLSVREGTLEHQMELEHQRMQELPAADLGSWKNKG